MYVWDDDMVAVAGRSAAAPGSIIHRSSAPPTASATGSESRRAEFPGGHVSPKGEALALRIRHQLKGRVLLRLGRRRCARQQSAADAWQWGGEQGKLSLRRPQLCPDRGSIPMMIWLRKQWLSQTDKMEKTFRDYHFDYDRVSLAVLKRPQPGGLRRQEGYAQDIRRVSAQAGPSAAACRRAG
jgi:hypothetical protein